MQQANGRSKSDKRVLQLLGKDFGKSNLHLMYRYFTNRFMFSRWIYLEWLYRERSMLCLCAVGFLQELRWQRYSRSRAW